MSDNLKHSVQYVVQWKYRDIDENWFDWGTADSVIEAESIIQYSDVNDVSVRLIKREIIDTLVKEY